MIHPECDLPSGNTIHQELSRSEERTKTNKKRRRRMSPGGYRRCTPSKHEIIEHEMTHVLSGAGAGTASGAQEERRTRRRPTGGEKHAGAFWSRERTTRGVCQGSRRVSGSAGDSRRGSERSDWSSWASSGNQADEPALTRSTASWSNLRLMEGGLDHGQLGGQLQEPWNR